MQRKRIKKQKSVWRKLLLFVLILMVIYVLFTMNLLQQEEQVAKLGKVFSSSSYPVIKQDQNQNYSGVGQKKVSEHDGYFTTFTSIKKKVYREYKQNGTSSWSQKDYWGGTMAENGCGITSMAIILSGYQKNITPDDLRKKYYPVLDGEKIPEELASTFGIPNSGFYYDDIHLSKSYLEKHLSSDRPVLVCLWNKPNDNRFTTASHYMVLLATDGQGMVYISNPNGLENDSKSSGWYDFSEITPYLAKVLYIEK